MTLTDFKINIYDMVAREYKPRNKQVAESEPPRKMFSFTFSYTGLMEGHDPLIEESYINSEHKGCMFYVQGIDELDWGYAKTTTFKGRQLNPSKPGKGLRRLVLNKLLTTREADLLREDIEKRRAWHIPDPSKPVSERLEIV